MVCLSLDEPGNGRVKRIKMIYFLTLYVPSIMFQCVDKPTRCNTSYEWSLLTINWLYMFRTITSPSPGASSHELYNVY